MDYKSCHTKWQRRQQANHKTWREKQYMWKNKELFGKGMEVTETPYENEDWFPKWVDF